MTTVTVLLTIYLYHVSIYSVMLYISTVMAILLPALSVIDYEAFPFSQTDIMKTSHL